MNESRVNLQHRPFLTPIWVTAGAAAAGFAFMCALFLVWIWGSAGSTTVVIAPDRPAAGEERYAQLARMFGSESGPGRLQAIFAANASSHPSLATLADRLHITVSDAANLEASGLAHRALHEHGARRVLIIAPASVFPALIQKLAGVDDIPNADGEPGVVYVVTVPRIGHRTLLRLNY